MCRLPFLLVILMPLALSACGEEDAAVGEGTDAAVVATDTSPGDLTEADAVRAADGQPSPSSDVVAEPSDVPVAEDATPVGPSEDASGDTAAPHDGAAAEETIEVGDVAGVTSDAAADAGPATPDDVTASDAAIDAAVSDAGTGEVIDPPGPGICGDAPTCSCIYTDCPLPGVPADLACTVLDSATGDCLAAIQGEYALNGCGTPCAGVTVAGLHALCEDAACANVASLLPGVIGLDPCTLGCDCEPDCADKECGDNGCGGSCGGCDFSAECVDGVCVTPTCGPGEITCECMVFDCEPGFASLAGAVCGAMAPCLDLVLDAWTSEGCGEPCQGWTIPGLETLCETGLCGGLLGFLGTDVCMCYCEPDCEGKACGDDGCGGSCGSCTGDDVCLGSQCVDGGGLCSGEASCACFDPGCFEPAPGSSAASIDPCVLIDGHTACRDAMLAEYFEDGCAPACEGLALPGIGAFCSDPACDSLKDILTFWYADAADLCACE